MPQILLDFIVTVLIITDLFHDIRNLPPIALLQFHGSPFPLPLHIPNFLGRIFENEWGYGEFGGKRLLSPCIPNSNRLCNSPTRTTRLPALSCTRRLHPGHRDHHQRKGSRHGPTLPDGRPRLRRAPLPAPARSSRPVGQSFPNVPALAPAHGAATRTNARESQLRETIQFVSL